MEIELSRIVKDRKYDLKTLENIVFFLRNEKFLKVLLNEIGIDKKSEEKNFELMDVLNNIKSKDIQGETFLKALKALKAQNLNGAELEFVQESYKKIIKSFWISTISMCATFRETEICLKVFQSTYVLASDSSNAGKSPVEKQWEDLEDEKLRSELRAELSVNIKYKLITITLKFIDIKMNLKEISNIDELFNIFKIESDQIRRKIKQILKTRAQNTENLRKFCEDIKIIWVFNLKVLNLYNNESADKADFRNEYLKHYNKQIKEKLMSDSASNSDCIRKIFEIYVYLRQIKKSIIKEDISKRFGNLINIHITEFSDTDLSFILKNSNELLEDDIQTKLFKRYQTLINENTLEKPLTVNPEDFKLKDQEDKTFIREQHTVGFYKDKLIPTEVIVKVYRNIMNLILRLQFKKEALFLQKFSIYDNFVKFYGIFEKNEDDIKHYQIKLYMEYCESDLEKYITHLAEHNLKRADFSEFLYLAENISLALALVHKEKIIHRDIKPDNIFISKNKVKLSDFSVSDYQNQNIGKSGTKGFRAPELDTNDKNTDWYKCDIYSLGMTLIHFYFLLRINHPETTKFHEEIEENLEKSFNDDTKENLEDKSIIDEKRENLKKIKKIYVKGLLKRMIDKDPQKRPLIGAVLGYIQMIKMRSDLPPVTELNQLQGNRIIS